MFSYSYIFLDIHLDHLIIFHFMGIILKIESRTQDYSWCIDLIMIGLFSSHHSSYIIDVNSLFAFVSILLWTPL